MNHAQQRKLFAITPPAAIVDNAAFTTATIDTLGADYLRIIAYFGAMDIAMAAMKVQESDDSGMSGAADIVGTRVGTDANTGGSASTLPSATADNTFFVFEIDLRNNRKRYLDLVCTGGDGTAGTFMCAFAELSKLEESPSSASEEGAGQVMRC